MSRLSTERNFSDSSDIGIVVSNLTVCIDVGGVCLFVFVLSSTGTDHVACRSLFKGVIQNV